MEKLSDFNELTEVKIIESLDSKLVVDWGLKVIKAPKIWNKTKGEGVKVAVIDTGIDTTHPDLQHCFKTGMNLFEKSFDVSDEYGHGTHVAGLIAGKHTGVAPNVELYIAKSLNGDGYGTIASVLDGITYAINYEVDIVCMSLGVPYDLPLIIKDRIIQAYNTGITIVCATGNSSHHEPNYPAFMDEVIAVGGLNKELKLASFSNYGKEMDTVAPAIDILSTYKGGKYARMSGTSMASPLVAGAIALLISHNRNKGVDLTPLEIKQKIMSLGEGHKNDMGYGIMDLTKLLK